MSPEPIKVDSTNVDLSQRFRRSNTVVASPAAAAETIIATITITADLAIATGVSLEGWAAFTVGTAGVSTQLRIRQTNVAGTVKADTGALTGGIVAAALVAQDVMGLDTAPVLPGQIYVLTLQVASANAASTVSAVFLAARAV